MLGFGLPGQFASVAGAGGGGGGGINPPAGQIGGTASNPTVTGITETSGPTALAVGAIANGQMLVRSGSSLVGQAVPGGVSDGDKGDIIVSSSGAAWNIDPTVATTAGRALMAGANAAAQRTTLGLGTAATSAASAFEVPLTFSGGLTRTTNTVALSNMAASTIKGQPVGGSGAPVDLTAAQVRAIIAAVSGSGTEYLNGQGNFTTPAGGGGGSGIDQLTGDVIAGPGTGSQAATIAAGAVSLSKMANLAQDQFIGRVTASTGVPETATITAAARTVLDDTTVAAMRTTLGAAGGTGTANGTNTGDQTITLTGDVTGSGGGSFSATIANSAVTNAKLANMATTTVKGQSVGGSGAPIDLTVAQLLAIIVSSSGGGTTNFLRADGSFAAPAGGGGGGILDVQHFQAESLDDADANWTNMVTTTAGLAVSPLTSSIQTRSYSGSVSNASGGKFKSPVGATNLKFDWMQQAASAPGTTNNKVQWQLAFRPLGSTSSPSIYNFTTKTMPNSTAFTAFTETLSLTTLGLTADTWYQFQLVRIITSVTNNMTQACQLSELITTWT